MISNSSSLSGEADACPQYRNGKPNIKIDTSKACQSDVDSDTMFFERADSAQKARRDSIEKNREKMSPGLYVSPSPLPSQKDEKIGKCLKTENQDADLDKFDKYLEACKPKLFTVPHNPD